MLKMIEEHTQQPNECHRTEDEEIKGGYIQKFDEFIKSIDNEILKHLTSKDKKLTEHISSIRENLWRYYKKIIGTSAGFYGIDEYIVFSTFKKFIEALNGQEFRHPNLTNDLNFFELEKNKKVLSIYAASKLENTPLNPTSKRAPDIAILKKENGVVTPIAVIEIKNYPEGKQVISAIEMLSQIHANLKDDHTKYVLFSFGKLPVSKGKTKNESMERGIDSYLKNVNNLLITDEGEKSKWTSKVKDLGEFLKSIREEASL